jgi:uncharacterized membrane protein YphA (DoxX/SURF4 family)
MDALFLVGRIMFALVFLGSAVGHLKNAQGMAGYATSKGIPRAKEAVLLTGVMLLVGAVSVVLGAYADLGSLLLISFLLPTAFLMHAFWKETDAMAKMGEQVQFLKNVGLAGGAIFLYVLLQTKSDFDFMLTGNLF